MSTVFMEAKRGHWILWNWGHRQWWLPCECLVSACWLYIGNTILGSLILFAHINLDIVSFHSCTRLNYFCFYFVKPGWHYCLIFYDRHRSVPCFLLHFYFLYSLYLWRIQGSEWKSHKSYHYSVQFPGFPSSFIVCLILRRLVFWLFWFLIFFIFYDAHRFVW